MSAVFQVGDTIVARATPPGTGGIAVVRISGPLVPQIAQAMLGLLPAERTATFRAFRDAEGDLLDQGIALYFKAPHSFTGEDVLELHAHGGPMVVSGLVDAAVDLGARRAAAGEFSKRAFLNDKLDLAQAEAIADLIASGSSQARRAALRSLSGAFSQAVDRLREKLDRLRVQVEAAIDFPEEEIDFLNDEALSAELVGCGDAFGALRSDASAGQVLRDGYRAVIVGRPNAGKSSLLNLLSGQEAAIVTEVAGTTRDILREQINIDGLLVELVDTAGLRDQPDRIEAEGIRRAREALRQADAILWIEDARERDDDGAPHDYASSRGEDLPADVPLVLVRNKIDLTGEAPGLRQRQPPAVAISARTGEGIDALRALIRELAGYRDLGEGAFTARHRHIDALDRARHHFDAGREALGNTGAGELLAEELRLSREALGEITGAITSDDLLGRIFAEFCIGK
ncbi:MAG TPA: tRNA uridine-5-carboxymethylaminomethyl(34) synthesis GTPase MnmE [Woeseiaceae bacterium]|nr:tRNA uridine-5-carboxymethylaminomethyl(34) synthesis GTPase MnmE [Woeseiaceae bacterium]